MTTAREIAAMEIAVKSQLNFILTGNATPIEIEQCLWNAVESGFLLGKALGVLEGITSQQLRGEPHGSSVAT